MALFKIGVVEIAYDTLILFLIGIFIGASQEKEFNC